MYCCDINCDLVRYGEIFIIKMQATCTYVGNALNIFHEDEISELQKLYG